MKEQITLKLLTGAIRRFATEAGLSPKEVQLVITTDDDQFASPKYKILHKYQPVEVVGFDRIYDGDDSIFSIMERTALRLLPTSLPNSVGQALAKIIINLAEKHGVLPSSVQVMIWTRDVQAGSLLFQLYVSTKSEDGKTIRQDKGPIELRTLL